MKFMKNVNKNLFKLSLIVFFSLFSYVNAVEFRGAAVENYKGTSSKKKINETLENAKTKACKNALENMFKKWKNRKE